MDRFSFLNAAHTTFFADLYEQYLTSPDSVEPSWRSFFQGFDFANEYNGSPVEQLSNAYQGSGESVAIAETVKKEFAVLKLIDAYRTHGHLTTKTNPFLNNITETPDLSIEKFGLSQADLNTTFDAAQSIQLPKSTLQQIITHLQNTYCTTIGIEYMYIPNEEKVQWIAKYVESTVSNLNNDQQKQILEKLVQAAAFENFFHTKYVGQKRFSLEGLEATIPALDMLIEAAANSGVEDVVIGMAHRGRLNILANIMQKPASKIFTEFDGKDYADVDETFDGDVKYHLGYTSERQTPSGKNITLNLAPNPSHLETVGAVIEGVVRAKQDKLYPNNFSKVLPIALHGDAAVAGQGIVYEIVQMSKLRAYQTAGTIHMVLNNQVGFTTNYKDARSGVYSTDIAKVVAAPVVHVNADDAEAAVKAMLFALAYRMQFNEDVFVDLIGYRKYGHNEGDEPRFTQPILYKLISKHQNARTIYNARLIENNVINDAYVGVLEDKYKALLEENLAQAKDTEKAIVIPFMQNEWKEYKIANVQQMLQTYETKVSRELLDEIAPSLTALPSDKKFISKVSKLIKDRYNMYYETNRLDWAMGELLAYGTLLTEGFDVRFTGQDVQRGTFSHRHAVVKTEDTEYEYVPLNNLKEQNGQMRIYNSHLSEYAVLGYEYGYAMANPKALTIWEAQFGDFSNGAQIMIDQYISAGEDKWGNQNGIVMLLPHGYEHQGAEHSSARLERYLQLCANHNIYVANCTTPANHFHMLRRQMVTNFRKPLVVMSPKSLLRHPEATSTIEELTSGAFQAVIDDPKVQDKNAVKTLVFVSGKFYYDLQVEKENLGRNDIAFVRLEQLFPLDTNKLQEIISTYPNVDDYVWAQEEPQNMGAYGYMLMNFNLVRFRVASPAPAAAPAAGSSVRSKARYAKAIAKVFNKNL
ncbi:2-oxoglutarate dehydrogenase E1 component [Myroides sp. JBRI-B21084]|uniref:2-oxoglutarate dehydrogenase E1 component n=1 Tax=Myroides sp. JBRI-B21084 TaxID=3119977 RepID=UPI0026E1DC39|nr:2-oxoglutarate dehydrogenase E1 component [Paenimyroides cloacae]WKW46695.1 2-oxoglutarate dehydrogenase E1 component [Paenimyroides cloacae]